MPPGVINMLPGDGLDVSEVALAHPDLAGIHFTGSTADVPAPVADRRREHRVVPLLPAHRRRDRRQGLRRRPPVSADPDVLRTALIRGAFEYQGQKCSAASRAYVAQSVWDEDARPASWPRSRRSTMGDVTDLSNFMGAVIDDRAFAKHKAAIDRAKRNSHLDDPRRRPGRRLGRLLRPADGRRVDRPDRRDVHHRVLRPDPRRARLRRRRLRAGRRSRWSRSRRTP